MVVLNFTKAGKSVSFTVMKMGNKTNVTADGSALNVPAAKTAKTDTKTDTAPADTAPAGARKSARLPTRVAVDELAQDVGVTGVPGGLFQDVHKHPAHRLVRVNS